MLSHKRELDLDIGVGCINRTTSLVLRCASVVIGGENDQARVGSITGIVDVRHLLAGAEHVQVRRSVDMGVDVDYGSRHVAVMVVSKRNGFKNVSMLMFDKDEKEDEGTCGEVRDKLFSLLGSARMIR